jgi:hypothetical protein
MGRMEKQVVTADNSEFPESAMLDDEEEVPHDAGDLSEMLNELRILLPGSQMLTSFLIVLPFSGGFRHIVHAEKLIFFATFVCSLISFVLFSAPAIQHRLLRPLRNRVRFKHLATQEIILGSIALSFALILATNLVVSEVFGSTVGIVTSVLIALLIGIGWWLLPRILKASGKF